MGVKCLFYDNVSVIKVFVDLVCVWWIMVRKMKFGIVWIDYWEFWFVLVGFMFWNIDKYLIYVVV